jgi:hypothetical protein
MESEILGLLIGLVATAGGLAVGAIIIYMAISTESKAKLAALEAKNKERLAFIEKGIDPGLLDKPAKLDKSAKDHTALALFWGHLLSGIGSGAFIGYLLSYTTGLNGAITINALAILFGGLGLLLYNKKRATPLQRSEKNV